MALFSMAHLLVFVAVTLYNNPGISAATRREYSV